MSLIMRKKEKDELRDKYIGHLFVRTAVLNTEAIYFKEEISRLEKQIDRLEKQIDRIKDKLDIF